MKVLLIFIFSILIAVMTSSVSAESWKVSMDANLTLTENAYSDNWVGGEVGSFSWAANSNSLAEKQISSKVNNKNTLKLSFGQTHSQDKDTKHWSKPFKSTDLIDFETVFRLTLGWFVDPFLAGRIETQFLDASDPLKNRLLNPATFTESFGMAKVLIKQEKRESTTRLGFGFKQRLNRDVLVDTLTGRRETQTSNNGGLISDSDLKIPLANEKILYTSKLTIYKALFFSEANKLKGKPNADYWKAPDINWENTFTANITKYLMVNLYLQLLYDKEIALGGRLKQTLALGMTFKLI